MSDRTAGPSETHVSVGLTVGLDVGDRFTHFCVLDQEGVVLEEGRLQTRPAALMQRFEGETRFRVVLETGTHSPWMSQLLVDLGHEVIVANSRQLRLIAHSHTKNDRADAETLARLGRLDPSLLRPVRHRSREAQEHLALLRSRGALVRARTALVNHVRGVAKSAGEKLPPSSAETFPKKARALLSPALLLALEPVIDTVVTLTERVVLLEERLEEIARVFYPQTALLRQVPGVGPLTSLLFILTLDDPRRFPNSRAVGSYLGLRPRQRDSGDRRPALPITKAGDVNLRQHLVLVAHRILGPFGADCDLRRFGLRLCAGGSRDEKKRAVVAVARKLAVLLHRLWLTGEIYEPLRTARLRGDVVSA